MLKFTFSIKPYTNVLLNFEKEKVLITGQSGKGKSLLMLALPANFIDYTGTVLFNQRPIGNVLISTDSLQQQIAYIPLTTRIIP